MRIEEGYGAVGTVNMHVYHEEPKGYTLHSIGQLWRTGYKLSDEAESSKNVREYYARQNALLRSYVMVMKGHPRPCVTAQDWQFLQGCEGGGERECEGEDERVRYAIVASNICNAILLCAQIYAFASSGSLAMLAVFLDAALDMVSGLVVMFTWYMKSKRDKHRYPVGRARLEPLGVIGMACLMTAATLLTLEQSITALVAGRKSESFLGLSFVSGAVLLSALTIKFGLYQYCSKVDDASVSALAEDHYNDCLSNVVSFFTVLIAQHALWWIDPVGGICISCLIIRNWVTHTLEHFDQLLGKAADAEMTNLLTFMACTHHEEVRHVDTVRVYHVGNGLYAEVDIVLDSEMPLHKAHDIGESLQLRIENLDNVERCFVHIDTETQHSPESEHKVI